MNRRESDQKTDLGLVDDYLLTNQAGKISDALTNPPLYAVQEAKALYISHHGRLPSPAPPEPLQPSENLKSHVSEFARNMNTFLNKANDKDATIAFNSTSWDSLQQEADKAIQALDAHNSKRRNWRHPFEAADNIGEKVACRMEFLLALIPSGDYTSILTGALGLAYNTATRKKEVREKILETLESLSNTINHTVSEIKMYSGDPELKDRSEQLYMSILDLVRHCTTYLNKSSALESFKAFFQQSRYGEQLEDAMENIKRRASDFDRCVSVCFQRRVQDIHGDVKSLKDPINAVYSLLAGIVKDFPAQLEELKSIMFRTANPTVQFIQLPAVSSSISTQQLRQLLSNGIHPSTENLLSFFQTDAQRASSFTLSHFNQEQIGLLMSDKRFMAWLQSLGSQLIVVHDESSLQDNSALSALSHLCALISGKLSSPGMLPLQFFCGLHTAASDPMGGSKGLLRSLALQLCLRFGDCNLPTPVDPSLLVQGLMRDDLITICNVFSILVQNVPAGVIYCLIDGASWYNGEARSGDMKVAVLYLENLVAQVQSGARGLVLKVMITNPTPRQRNSWGIQAPDLYLEQSLLAGGHRDHGIELSIAG